MYFLVETTSRDGYVRVCELSEEGWDELPGKEEPKTSSGKNVWDNWSKHMTKEEAIKVIKSLL